MIATHLFELQSSLDVYAGKEGQENESRMQPSGCTSGWMSFESELIRCDLGGCVPPLLYEEDEES